MVTVIRYDLSAFCEYDGCQAPSPVPQLTSGKRQARREGGGDRGRAGVGSFPGRKFAGCFSQNEIAIGPRENAFPTPGPSVALDGPGIKSIASR